MDISLTNALIGLKTCIHTAETYFEGRVSQNFDLGLSFCFIVCRRREFGKYNKKSQKLPVFCHKIQTKA